jgi:replication factor C small subunit
MSLLVEKYRPKSLDDFVGDEKIKLKIKNYLISDEIPHLLFYGRPGVGKTSICKIIVNSLDCDYLYLNSSDENSVETVRTKIKDFVTTVGFNRWKIVFLDEVDNLTHSSMSLLRNLMEEYSNYSRFLLTCNYIEKIIEPITSRCQLVKLEPTSVETIKERMELILKNEGIQYSPMDLDGVVRKNYPDMRRILNEIHFQTSESVFTFNPDYKSFKSIDEDVLLVLKSSMSKREKMESIHKLLKNHDGQDFNQLFSFLYRKVEEYGGTKVGKIITILSDGQFQLSFSMDKELCFMGSIVKIIGVND